MKETHIAGDRSAGGNGPGARQGMPAPAECRELVERIAASSDLHRSARLVDFLRYICHRAIDDAVSEIREQEMGAAVFGRTPDYDTAGDPIVRVQASQLRRKLQHYFETEGAGETVTLEIPKGGYVPLFRYRTATPSTAGIGQPAAPAAPSRYLAPVLLGIVATLALACAVLGIRLWRLSADQDYAGKPALRLLWSNLIRPNQKTSVVVADSCFGFLQDALGMPLDLETYLKRDPLQWLRGAKADLQLTDALKMMAFRQYTSIADLGIARRILLLSPSHQSQVSIVFARDYNARGPVSDNVVLLGSHRSNPWAELHDSSLNFQFDYDEASRKAIVRNRNPRAGESATYLISGEGPGIREGYATLTFLPNQGHTAHVLIVAGTDMEATEAVGQLATTEAEFQPVAGKLAPDGRLPYFEALFKTRRFGGAPQECRLVAWRRIGN